MKNGAVSDAAKLIKPTFSPAEIKRFRAVKSGSDILKMTTADQRKFEKWQGQRSTAIAKRAMRKNGMW